MTVSSTYQPPQYEGDGVTTQFAFPFQYFAATDLSVVIWNSAANAFVSPPPALNGAGTYDFAVTGTQDATGTGEYLYGTVTFNNAPPTTYTLTILRNVPETQNDAFTNYGPFPAKTVEAALDKLTIIDQQTASLAARAIVIPPGDPTGTVVTLPPAEARAGMAIVFDSQGNVSTAQLPNGTVVVSSAMLAVLAAASTSLADALLRAPYDSLLLTDYAGADPSGTTYSDSAFTSFVAAVMASGRPGVIPPGRFKFASQATMDFGLAAAGSGSARFTGTKGRSILDFTAVTASPALQITDTVGGEAAFYGAMTGISIHGNLAGVVVAIGKPSHADAFNGFQFDLEIKNNSASTSAVGLQVNGAYNCDFSIVTNCNGHGDAFQATEMAFCRCFGSYSNADTGLHLTSYYVFGNTFDCLDLEVVNTCVVIDSANAVGNTWTGGQFVWTNGSGPSVTGVNATAGGNNRFVGVNFASRGTSSLVTNAVGVIIYGAGTSVDVETFGGLQIAALTGDSDIELAAAAGAGGYLLIQQTVAGSPVQRWGIGKNNATESGANVGSDLIVTRYSDAGAAIDNPLTVTRSTGVVSVPKAAIGAGGGTLSFYGAALQSRPTVSGSRAGGAALTSLIGTLSSLGLITDGTSA